MYQAFAVRSMHQPHCHCVHDENLAVIHLMARARHDGVCACRLEFLEAAGCNLLSLNVAWDSDTSNANGSGFASFEAAAADAAWALLAARPAQPATSPALQVGLLQASGSVRPSVACHV